VTGTTTRLRFRLPDLGEGVAETEIVRWLVADGAAVVADEPMVEVMTDKATVEIPAPATGTVASVLVPEGQVVPVGTVIVEIDTDDVSVVADNKPVNVSHVQQAAPAAAPSAGAAPRAAGGKVQATPLVRKLAAQLGVELDGLTGSGPNGRITEADVRDAAGDSSGASPGNVIPIRGMRRQIAEHLTKSSQAPTVTVVEEAELTAVESARASSNHSLLAYLVQATVAGLKEVPELNATIDMQRGEIARHDRIDLGIAVQTDDGLVVPVLRDCANLDLAAIDKGIAELADAAKAGSLEPAQLRGGTFTITSAGKLGGVFTTPLLNAPEVGILGLHRAEDRAVVRDGAVVVRRMANLSVTFDHRALDGLAASRFLLATIDRLQQS
jgi:pyruvate/2-oxoglutarate dehydrogenase complex dihydrolipoamide acyltransferase (E2) component